MPEIRALVAQREAIDSQIVEVDREVERLLLKKRSLMASREAIIAKAEEAVEGMSTRSGLRSLLEIAGPAGVDIERILRALLGRSATGGGTHGTVYGYLSSETEGYEKIAETEIWRIKA